MKKIVLASASARRQDIFKQASIPFEVYVSNVDESIGEEVSPYDVVKQLSQKKAISAFEAISEPVIIIAADTIVSLHGKVMGKPKDEQDAFAMLKALQGKNHSVYTGVTMIDKDDGGYALKNIVDTTNVTMRKLTDDEIWAYIRTDEPFDKAGSYGIQGRGSVLVERVEGDFYTVVGLPLVKVCMALSEWGFDVGKYWD